jgi:tetratricopeptide (TPR) repeat protein
MTTFQAQPLFMPVSLYICRSFPIKKIFFPVRAIYISFFLSLFLLPNFCLAQKEKIDSLKKVLPLLKDSARVDCLNALSNAYIDNNFYQIHYYVENFDSHTDTADFYAKKAYTEAIALNYTKGIGDAYLRFGEISYNLKNFHDCERHFRQAIVWQKKVYKNREVGLGLLGLGNALDAQGLFEDAKEAFEQASKNFEQVNDQSGVAAVLEKIGIIYQIKGHYETAFGFCQKALQVRKKINDHRGIAASLVDIAVLYREIENYETALDYYRQSVQYARSYGLSWNLDYSIAQIYFLQKKYDSSIFYYQKVLMSYSTDQVKIFAYGLICLMERQYEKALSNFLELLPLLKKGNNVPALMWALHFLGKTYDAIQNYTAALQHVNESLAMAQKMNASRCVRDDLQLLSEIYDHLKKIDSAYLYSQKFTAIKDSIVNDQIKGKLVAYSYEQKIELMDKEKEFQQVNLQKESLFKNILIAGILVLLLLGTFIFRNIVLKRKTERNQREIAENELQIQKLESEKTKAELQRQATELEMQALRAQMNPHFIFNSLNSINRFILQNNKAQASEYLTKFSKLVRLILQNSQAALIPLETELESLQLYLELESVRFDHHFEFKIKVEEDLDVSSIKVPPLIIQPYAENAIWHGLMHKEEKGHLEIELYQQDDMLRCKINDDGIGRKKATELKDRSGKHKSMGMKITESRIAMMQKMNGECKSVEIRDLVDAEGNSAGTEVVVKIPVVQQS